LDGGVEEMTMNQRARFSHYEILSPIGAGGLGEVYRAGDERPGRQIAKLTVSPIARAGDSSNQRYPKPDAESWLFRKRINK
jgi:hypothetical protein